MKRKSFAMTAFLSVLALIIQLFTVYAHNLSTPYSWYLKFSKPNTPPESIDLSAFGNTGNAIWLDTSSEGQKKIYLTFDVGYDDGNITPILDALKAHNAKAAFFVLPHFITASPELLERMISDGHLICNHTTHHKNLSKVSSFSEFEAELKGVEDIYREATGLEMSKFLRPPEGRFNENTLIMAEKAGYRPTFWSLAYADWDKNKQPNPEKALGLLLSRVHDGCVILLHPTSSTNAAIMDRLLTEFEARGYSFGTLDEFPSTSSPSEKETPVKSGDAA